MSARRTKVANHAGVYYRDTPQGRRYEIDYVDETGRRRWKTVEGSLRDADALRDEYRGRKRRGERVAPSKETLAEVAAAWLALQTHLRPRTRSVYETNLRVHVLPRLGRRRIAEIDVEDVARLLSELRADGLAPWTIRGVLTSLGRVFSHAARRNMIAANPIARLERGERPKVERREMRVLDGDGIERLLDETRPNYRTLIATAIFTGLRQGELLGLTWGDLDLDGGLVRVRKQLDRSGKRVPPKTPQAAREVVLMPALVKMLREHKAEAFALGRAGAGAFVFATEAGTPFYWRNVSKRGLEGAAERAGLIASKAERMRAKAEGTEAARLRFHDLRHSFASMLIAQGHDVVFVSRQLGHASPNITLGVYGHLFDGRVHADKARAGLEAAYGTVLERTDGDRRLTGEAREAAKVAYLGGSATGGD